MEDEKAPTRRSGFFHCLYDPWPRIITPVAPLTSLLGGTILTYPHSLVLLQEFLPCPKQRNSRFRLD